MALARWLMGRGDPLPALEADLTRAAGALLEHVAARPAGTHSLDSRPALDAYVRAELVTALGHLDRGQPTDPLARLLERCALLLAHDRAAATKEGGA
jgi:hypothetical protein